MDEQTSVVCACKLEERRIAERRERAIARCEAQIGWYNRYALKAWTCWYALQIGAITLGGLTPVLILLPSVPKPVQAFPSALGALLVSINSIFHSRSDAVRMAHARDMLKSEYAKYLTRTTEHYGVQHDENAALDTFMGRVEEVAMRESTEWRNVHLMDVRPMEGGQQTMQQGAGRGYAYAAGAARGQRLWRDFPYTGAKAVERSTTDDAA